MTGLEAFDKLKMCINVKHYIGPNLTKLIEDDLLKVNSKPTANVKSNVQPKSEVEAKA